MAATGDAQVPQGRKVPVLMPAVCAAAPTAGSRLWIQWTLSNHGQLTIVSFAGEIDRTNADRLVETLLTVLRAGSTRLVLDVSGVSFVDVAGGRALLTARQHAADQEVRLDIVCTAQAPRLVLELHGADDASGLHRTVPEALRLQAERERLQKA